jgi:GAF domain-containing protein
MLAGGPGVLVSEITPQMLADRAHDEEHLQLIRTAGLRSVIIAPIRAGAATVGAITLITAESARAFNEDDFEFATALGRRLATALQPGRGFRVLPR